MDSNPTKVSLPRVRLEVFPLAIHGIQLVGLRPPPRSKNGFPKRNWSFTGGAKNFRRCLEGNKQTFNCVCVCLFSIGKTYHISLFGGDIVVFCWILILFLTQTPCLGNKYVCYKNGFIFPLKFGVIFSSNIWSFTTQIYALDRYFSPTSCCLRKPDHETCTLHAWWKNRQPMIVDHSPLRITILKWMKCEIEEVPNRNLESRMQWNCVGPPRLSVPESPFLSNTWITVYTMDLTHLMDHIRHTRSSKPAALTKKNNKTIQ